MNALIVNVFEKDAINFFHSFCFKRGQNNFISLSAVIHLIGNN